MYYKSSQFTDKEYQNIYMMFKQFIDEYNYYQAHLGIISHWDIKQLFKINSRLYFITESEFLSGITIKIYKQQDKYVYVKKDADDSAYNINYKNLTFEDIETNLYVALDNLLDTVRC